MTDECIELPVPERSALHPEPLPRVELFKALVRASDRQVSETNTLCQEFGITASQYNVLRILRGAMPKGLPTLEIGTRMIERTPGVTRASSR